MRDLPGLKRVHSLLRQQNLRHLRGATFSWGQLYSSLCFPNPPSVCQLWTSPICEGPSLTSDYSSLLTWRREKQMNPVYNDQGVQPFSHLCPPPRTFNLPHLSLLRVHCKFTRLPNQERKKSHRKSRYSHVITGTGFAQGVSIVLCWWAQALVSA